MSVPSRVFTIAANLPFAETLAQGLLRRAGPTPFSLSDSLVLLPTRRACRALREAFLNASEGRPLLLPQMMPLGDIDAEEMILTGEAASLGASAVGELPPAMPEMQRRLRLAQLVLAWMKTLAAAPISPGQGAGGHEEQAIGLAEALARLMDQVETEGLDFTGLAQLAPERYAEHWQITLQFLEIATKAWPGVEAETGAMGPAARRRRLLEMQAELWRKQPPRGPVIAAGSTGSIPATAELIGVVATLEQGEVVLPGLDLDSPQAVWEEVEGDPSHPQYGLAQLLRRLGIERSDVSPWPESEGPARRAPDSRVAFVAEALWPASATADWPGLVAARGNEGRQRFALALDGLQRIDCPGESEEAEVVALILREALETPSATAALVTPDRALARRVAAALRRWGIEIDDSAGVPLGETAVGVFLRLTAGLLFGELAPLDLLSALKHPLAAGGLAPRDFRSQVRRLEMAALRGPRPAPGFAGLRAALDAARESRFAILGQKEVDKAQALVDGLEALADAHLSHAKSGRFAALLDAHIGFAEALAASSEDPGSMRLWRGEDGALAAEFLSDLRAAAPTFEPAIGKRGYPGFFAGLLHGTDLRPRYGRHPRLTILGPLEARLVQADTLVLGALNEGSWPALADPGPWLSRQMRAEFGLPPVERRIGLAAHDFLQACGASRVYLTRATHSGGAPSVASRWLLRLAALEKAYGLSERRSEAASWISRALGLDRPAAVTATAAPRPCPPLEARPRKLSVTKIETLLRNPYDIYAERILGLRKLDPLDAEPGAAERGTIIHAALERFLVRAQETGDSDLETLLLECGREVFEGLGVPPGITAFWWPRFLRVAAFVAAWERGRRGGIATSVAEIDGKLAIETPGGPFTLTAKADRIDHRRGGGLELIDYKTGQLPSVGEVKSGWSPQLPLEAAIAKGGGFEGLPAGEDVAALTYLRLSGGEPAGEERPALGRSAKVSPEAAAADALAGLTALIAAFDDPAMPYLARPRQHPKPRFSDYEHLARVKEWSTEGAEG